MPPRALTGRIVVALLALLVIAAGMATMPRSESVIIGTPRAPAVSPSVDAFRAGFRPLLARAAREAEVLVAMGESRERNLLRIRAGQNAMQDALAATDAWLAAHPPPAADSPAIAVYQDGAASIRAAMDEAQAGFLRLDFDRVARATATMRQGAAALEQAIALLRE